jgi:TRAP-type C4-dicarboxylate transport system permease small subunit
MSRLGQVTRWLLAIAAISLFAMMVITITDILMHNFLRQPIRGTFDLVEVFLVFVVFLGIPEVFRREGNITVDVIDHFISASTKWALRAAALIVTFGFLLLLGFAMITPAMDAVTFPEHKQETGIPTWLLWMPILVGIAFATLATAVRGAWWMSERHDGEFE